MNSGAPDVTFLWDTYALPETKRIHCLWVSRLAVWFAQRLMEKNSSIHVDITLLETAALVHDIDKTIPKLQGERHPDAAVRVLRERGYTDVADVVQTHPLHAILDNNISPKSWEEKILYLSDKMVKQEVITVDKRFALWRAENLPKEAVAQLDAAYPKVKLLEQEICSILTMRPDDIALSLQEAWN